MVRPELSRSRTKNRRRKIVTDDVTRHQPHHKEKTREKELEDPFFRDLNVEFSPPLTNEATTTLESEIEWLTKQVLASTKREVFSQTMGTGLLSRLQELPKISATIFHKEERGQALRACGLHKVDIEERSFFVLFRFQGSSRDSQLHQETQQFMRKTIKNSLRRYGMRISCDFFVLDDEQPMLVKVLPK